MQQVVVITYRRFGTNYRSQEYGTDSLFRNVGKKLPLLDSNNPEERNSLLRRGGSLKLRILVSSSQ